LFFNQALLCIEHGAGGRKVQRASLVATGAVGAKESQAGIIFQDLIRLPVLFKERANGAALAAIGAIVEEVVSDI
jgi:ABC-type enterobactin transport system permease subunit